MRGLLVAGALLLSAAPVGASVWDRALATPADVAAVDTYDAELRTADEHVGEANTYGSSLSEKKRQLKLAIDGYQRAAAARPASAEPYFRIAELLYSFYADSCGEAPLSTISPLRDCTLGYETINRPVADQLVAALAEAEQRAPLDPRFSAGAGSVLFARALIHTRLATIDQFKLAAADYEEFIARADTDPNTTDTAWSNLAETYMMMGDLEASIEAYRQALRTTGQDASTWYGFAVALDRDGRATKALEVIRAQGEAEYATFMRRVAAGVSFYVPRGEVFYYYALADEAFGRDGEAYRHWQMFIDSGAHPQFQARAKEHLAALIAKHGVFAE